nr:unnamed protein product [Spirometra erinaceieuropaei]
MNLWHHVSINTPIISVVLLYLTFALIREAYAHPGDHLLQLVSFEDSDRCLEEFEVFDLRTTTKFAIFHATLGIYGEMTADDIKEFSLTVHGCSIRESIRNRGLLNALIEAEKLASLPFGFTVLIGPVLPSDCNFVADWIRQGESANIGGLYQIQFNCRRNALVQPSVQVNISNPEEKSAGDLVALSMTIQISTLLSSLNVLLRHYGWQRIAIIYEMSLESLQNRLAADRLHVFLSSSPNTIEPFHIVSFGGLRWSSHPSWYLRNFTQPVDAIILLARPPLANFFLHSISNMAPIREGRIAIIQIDLSSAITYDILRFWRLALLSPSDLGAAGQSLFIMTALPAGTGYDASASILDSANGGVLPKDADFFQPLMDEPVDVPVLPNITYRFSRDGDTFYDYYDFYFFSLSQKICDGSANSSQTPYDEIFELTSVILWPLTQLVEVQTKIWPNGSEGPKKNHCMQTGCYSSDTTTFIILLAVQLLCVAALATTVGLFFRHHQKAMKLRKGNNKLVLYPDDVNVTKPDSNRKQSAKVAPEQWLTPGITSLVDADTADSNTMKSGESTADDGIDAHNGMVTYNGTPIYIKPLNVPVFSLKSKLIELLRTLREVRNENVNRFVGCYLDTETFNLVYEHCSHGSLREILCCSEPFPDCDLSAEEIVEKVRAGDPPFRPEVNIPEIPYFYKDLMRSSWTENPDFRPTFQEIIVQLEQYSSGKLFYEALHARNISLK